MPDWFGFHALSGSWLFLAVPPLVLFYFLKLRRPRQVVPSLVLWRQVLADRRVNSPFQRFKRNLLLLVQLLLLCLLCLAGMQPFLRSQPVQAVRIPILIDNSASMGARDEQGQSRLELAKARVRARIESLLPDQEIALISFSAQASRRCGFTSNKRVLLQALDEISVEDLGSDLEQALRLAQALSRTTPFQRVQLLSDGNFSARTNFDLPFELDYEQLPAAGDNFGITTLNARREGRQWRLFVSVEGKGSSSGTLEIDQDGERIGARDVSLSGEAAKRLVFDVDGAAAAAIELRLVVDGHDALASDNRAFLQLPMISDLRVYVPMSLPSWRQALAAIDDVLLFPAGPGESAAGHYDLIVVDTEVPAGAVAAVSLTVGIIPSALSDLITVGEGAGGVVDWLRNAPLLQYVELGDLLLSQVVKGASVDIEQRLESLGYEILLHGDQGPLLLRSETQQAVAYHLLFNSDNSTLPYRVGFPVLVSNLAQVARRRAGMAAVDAAATGVLPNQASAAGAASVIVRPDGETQTVLAGADGVLRGIAAPLAGAYELDGRTQLFASLLSAAETTLHGEEQLAFNELSVSAAAVTPTDRALWPYLVLAALLLLAIEWRLFNHRPPLRSATA